MLAKLTSKNQLTLPKPLVEAVGGAEYFEASAENGRIVLTPVRITAANAVRDKLRKLGIDESEVPRAVEWARRRR